jgi:hypothetical protein
MAKITKKDREKMKVSREVAGTIIAAKQLYDIAEPVIREGYKRGKTYLQNRKKKRDYPTNSYKEGE